jgi:copper chaperone CopZ
MKVNNSIFLSILLMMLFVVANSNAQSNELKTAEIKTSAVCESCKERIEKKVSKLEGVVEASLDVDTKILNVKYDESKISLEEIRTEISKIGYDADDVKRNPKAYKKLPKCCRIDG